MEENLTFRLISALNTKEQRAFITFLKSPFFNNRDYMERLFLEVRDSDRHVPPLTIPELANIIFPDKADGVRAIEKALSYLNGLIHKFLTVQEFLEDSNLQRETETRALSKKTDLGNRFNLRANRLLVENLRSAENGYSALHRLRMRVLIATHPHTRRVRRQDETLQSIDEELHVFYYVFRLKILCNQLNKHRRNDTNALETWQNISKEVKKYAPENLLLELYCKLTELFCAKSNEAQGLFDEILENYLDDEIRFRAIDKSERQDALHFLFNYANSLYRETPNNDSFNKLLKLYKVLSEDDFWDATPLEERLINVGVLLSSRLGNGEDVEKEYSELFELIQQKLPEAQSEQAIALIKAYRHFKNKESEEALNKLRLINTRLPHYVLRVNALAVRAGYDCWLADKTTNIEVYLSQLEMHLGNNNHYSNEFLKPYKDLLYFVKHLIHEIQNVHLKSQLSGELKNRKPIDFDWVAQKIDELPAR